jgi:hypothetical protein
MSLQVRSGLVAALALSLLGACEDGGATRGTSGAAGTGSPGTAGTTGAAGNGSTGAAGNSSGAAGEQSGAAGNGGGPAGNGGGPAGDGGGVAGTNGGASGTGGGASGTGGGAAGTGGGAAGTGGGAGRAINVTGTGTFSMSYMGQPLYLNKDKKPIRGKLFLLLPGIGNGPGAGGFESFVKMYGFHVFAPKTNTNLTGGMVPQMYKDMLKTDAMNKEANRQVADARMELWDGKDRVSWFTPPTPIVEQTVNAIKFAQMQDPGGDWGFFLNADGTLRTSDVWVTGYSWGAQTWSMISTYVPFGRVVVTSGPVAEGFPNGAWMTDPSATPLTEKYCLASDGQADEIFPNVMKAMWGGAGGSVVTKVTPTSAGPYMMAQHLFEMVGGAGGTTPGGHTVFCNDNLQNGWLPVCKHVLGVE